MEPKQGISEDWLSFYLGIAVFILGLGYFIGLDLLGWGIKTSVWMDITKSLSPVSASFKGVPGLTSLFLTYLFMLVLTEIGAAIMGVRVGKFILAFSIVFWISYFC
jgi:hypothetical protein